MVTYSSSLENVYSVANYIECKCGRVVRLSEGKNAEFFTIVINDTVETEWLNKSRSDNNFILIDENNLMKVLQGEPYETYKKPVSKFTYRF